MAPKVYGRITNYRTGIRSQTSRECLIEFEQVTSASLASKLVGQRVAWKSGKSMLVGRILGPHGRNGMVRARFQHGVPGQAIGTMVELFQ